MTVQGNDAKIEEEQKPQTPVEKKPEDKRPVEDSDDDDIVVVEYRNPNVNKMESAKGNAATKVGNPNPKANGLSNVNQ